MEKNKFEELKLSGRIYPAIILCINNRYRIFLGIFAYYGFVLNLVYAFNKCINNEVHIIVSVIFTLLLSHNYFNYLLNNKEQHKIENQNSKAFPWFKETYIELGFDIVGLFIIWIAYFILKKIITCA